MKHAKNISSKWLTRKCSSLSFFLSLLFFPYALLNQTFWYTFGGKCLYSYSWEALNCHFIHSRGKKAVTVWFKIYWKKSWEWQWEIAILFLLTALTFTHTYIQNVLKKLLSIHGIFLKRVIKHTWNNSIRTLTHKKVPVQKWSTRNLVNCVHMMHSFITSRSLIHLEYIFRFVVCQ